MNRTEIIELAREGGYTPEWMTPDEQAKLERFADLIEQRLAGAVEPLTDSFVQQVPDKCDRIVWRGTYYHLPLAPQPQPSPMQELSEAFDKAVEQFGAERLALALLSLDQSKQEPVAWAGYDLDAMCEAFHRCIEAQADKQSPFHQPINADATTALRILRGFVPAMKAYATAPQPQPNDFFKRFQTGLMGEAQPQPKQEPVAMLKAVRDELRKVRAHIDAAEKACEAQLSQKQ